jgi:hypothetical protein
VRRNKDQVEIKASKNIYLGIQSILMVLKYQVTMKMRRGDGAKLSRIIIMGARRKEKLR